MNNRACRDAIVSRELVIWKRRTIVNSQVLSISTEEQGGSYDVNEISCSLYIHVADMMIRLF